MSYVPCSTLSVWRAAQLGVCHGLHVAQIGLDVEGHRTQVNTLLARIGAMTTSLLSIPVLLGAVARTGDLIASSTTSKPSNITLYYWKVHQTYSQVGVRSLSCGASDGSLMFKLINVWQGCSLSE